MPTLWETKIVTLTDFHHKHAVMAEVEALLNTLGSRGWEIAGVTTPTNSSAVTVFLKRPRA